MIKIGIEQRSGWASTLAVTCSNTEEVPITTLLDNLAIGKTMQERRPWALAFLKNMQRAEVLATSITLDGDTLFLIRLDSRMLQ